MFLTTETSIPGNVSHKPIKVIHAAVYNSASGGAFSSTKKAMNQADALLEQALGLLQQAAFDIQADGYWGFTII